MPKGDFIELLSFKGLMVRGEEGTPLGPLDLSLKLGESILITHSDIPVLKSLIRLSLGWAGPLEGEVLYKEKPVYKDGESLMDLWSIGNEISVVHRESRLLMGRSVYENIMIHYLYNRSERIPALKEEALSHLEKIGFKEKYLKVKSHSLPERDRRLGLYAAAIAKEPLLFILERPMQFLDKDFPKVWKIIKDATQKKSAVLVLGREREGYSREDFDESFKF
jgi:ABC-type ATPase involved in cell division